MEIAPTWTCPEVRPLAGSERAAAQHSLSALASHSELRIGPVTAAGLELRAALMSLQDDRGFRRADNAFWKKKCRSLFLRPAVEPILFSYWRKLSPLHLDASSALRIASALAGRPLVYRKGPAVGRSSNGDVHFERLESPEAWLS